MNLFGNLHPQHPRDDRTGPVLVTITRTNMGQVRGQLCGQFRILISKELFGIFNSPKKRTKNVYPSKLGQKLEFSSSFFGRIEDINKGISKLTVL